MFRFTIRDVLWLTVVVAVMTGWWSQQAILKREQAAVAKERAELATKRADLDQRFLRIVDATDRLNLEQARASKNSSPDNRP